MVDGGLRLVSQMEVNSGPAQYSNRPVMHTDRQQLLHRVVSHTFRIVRETMSNHLKPHYTALYYLKE